MLNFFSAASITSPPHLGVICTHISPEVRFSAMGMASVMRVWSSFERKSVRAISYFVFFDLFETYSWSVFGAFLSLEDIKEGMTERQVADFIDAEYLKEGASGNSFPTIVCFGENAADQHHEPSETRTLKAGECILIDMGCVWKGYCSDMTRTFYCKSVDEEQAKIHDIVRTAVLKAEEVIKPGIPVCDIDKQARDYIDEMGYTKYWGVRLGHFIGQDDHEFGDVSPINHNPAAVGNIFSIEPGIYIEGKFGVRVEDLVLVTEDGHELLNHVEKKYRIVG